MNDVNLPDAIGTAPRDALQGTSAVNPRRRNLATFWLPLAVVALLGIPLYVVMLAVIIRSRLFDFGGPEFTDEQFKALIAFIGVALGTTATVLGIFITQATSDRAAAQQAETQRRTELAEREAQMRQQFENDRAAALKAESERRAALAEAESLARQKLDTAVQVLGLIKQENGYPGKAVIGGALTTLVHLGHPVIAMRTLHAAVSDDAVDISTAIWLIDQVLGGGTRTDTERSDLAVSKHDAAQLLLAIAKQLPDDVRVDIRWPSCAHGRWPGSLDDLTGINLLFAMLTALTQRPMEWWDDADETWFWVIDSLVAAAEDETGSEHLRAEAATYALLLVEGIDERSVDDAFVSNVRRQVGDLAHADQLFYPQIDALVMDWLESARRQRATG